MKLFYSETLNPRKACAVAKYLGAPVEYVRIDLATGENRTPAFLAMNPNGKVPVLQDGETTLWEANAIMCHLARVTESDLWPKGERQVEVIRWLSWNADHFTRFAGTLYFQNLIKPLLGFGAPDVEVVAATLPYAKVARIPIDDFAEIQRWHGRLNELPAWRDPFPGEHAEAA
jgi:glutathione S-transferase